MRYARVALGMVAGLTVGVGVLVALATLSCGDGDAAAPLAAGEAHVASDVHGALAEVVVHHVDSFGQSSLPTLVDLFGALPADVVIHVVVEDQRTFDDLLVDLDAAGVSQLGRLRPLITGVAITPWAKDRFGTMVGADGRPVVAVPPTRPAAGTARGNDALVPDLLCEALDGVACRTLPFAFEGGDLLSDGERLYMLANFPARSQPVDATEREALIADIEDTLGLPAVLLGDRPGDVPDHHVGMMVTPLGDGVVAVADPDLGRTLFEPLAADYPQIGLETDETRYEPFRRVHRDLVDAGLGVIAVPMVLTTEPRVYVTYNNALVEIRDGQPRIYMPTYGIDELDRAATAVFGAAGLEVFEVDVSLLYRHTGSLRCQVGVIRRGV